MKAFSDVRVMSVPAVIVTAWVALMVVASLLVLDIVAAFSDKAVEALMVVVVLLNSSVSACKVRVVPDLMVVVPVLVLVSASDCRLIVLFAVKPMVVPAGSDVVQTVVKHTASRARIVRNISGRSRGAAARPG